MKECPECEYAMYRELEMMDEGDHEKGYCFKWECKECGHVMYTYPLEN